MKKLTKVFLSFMLIIVNIFSIMSFSNGNISTLSEAGAFERVEGQEYYFNREYYYDKGNIIENTTALYGEYYNTTLKFIDEDQISIRFGHGRGIFKYIKSGSKYKLKLEKYTYDKGWEQIGMPDASNVYMEVNNIYTGYPGAYILEHTQIRIYFPYQGKDMTLQFSTNSNLKKSFEYRLYDYNFIYNNNSTESVDNPEKYRFNDFLDYRITGVHNPFAEITHFINGIEYKYNVTLEADDKLKLTLITGGDDPLFETATIKFSSDSNSKVRAIITFSNDNITSGTLRYTNTLESMDEDINKTPSSDATNDATNTVDDLANSIYGEFFEIARIALPIFIGVVVVFGLFFGLKLAVKYSKAEEEEEKKKVKSSLISVVIGCLIAVLIVSIFMIIISS